MDIKALKQAESAEHLRDATRMVDRFLAWKLPKDFAPDAGISFNPTKPYEGDEFGNSWWPTGTNLFTADQALAMFEHCAQWPEQPAPASVPDEMRHEPLRPDEPAQEQFVRLQYVKGWNDCRAAMLAATPKPEAPASVPDGWQLVPVTPTEEMLQDGWEQHEGSVESMYIAMLAAAPKPDGE